MNSGILYPDYNDTVGSVSSIRELFLGQTRTPRVKFGDPSTWVEIGKVVVRYMVTLLGSAFVGILYGGDLAGENALLHICLLEACLFVGGRISDYLISEQKPGAAHMLLVSPFQKKNIWCRSDNWSARPNTSCEVFCVS